MRFRRTNLRACLAVRFQGDLNCLYRNSKPRDLGSLSFHLRLLGLDLLLLCLDQLLLHQKRSLTPVRSDAQSARREGRARHWSQDSVRAEV
jgi:hypothetical protein